MIPNMYKMAGELLPSVIHVSARTVATHALNIFGDHSDVYACRQTAMPCCAPTLPRKSWTWRRAHLSAIKGRVPFLHFFDGFRTSHEIQKIQVWDYEGLGDLLDWDACQRVPPPRPEPRAPRAARPGPDRRYLLPGREACNKYYDAVPEVWLTT